MRILFVNPNTTSSFTKRIGEVARAYALPTTEVVALQPSTGPRSIESIYDELLSAPGTLKVILEHSDFDAYVIACYSDHPTVYAAREILDQPVIGIAEASMLVACTLGHSFSVVTTNDEWGPLLRDAVRHYGLSERCASVRTTGAPVLALEESATDMVASIGEAAKLAVAEDGAEVICLGCAGMAGLDKGLEAEVGVPVIDGVVAALKLLEGLVAYGVHTSKHRAYARPGRKEVVGMDAVFNRPYRA
jgi:allantoin racemase